MALTRITKGVIKPNENYDTHNINSTGIVTAIGLDVNGNGDISGNLSVGGVITYEDVTSIDSVGIITAQKDIHVGAGLSVVGVSTFNNDVTLTGVGGNTPDSAIWDYSDKSLNIGNSAFLKFGSTTYSSGQQLQIYQSGSIGFTIFKSLNNNQIAYQNDRLFFNNQANNTALARIESAEGVSLYYTGTKRLQTSGIGITVTGTVVATGADINGDLDVDGHTNLDNVSIAGVTTFSGVTNHSAVSNFAANINLTDGYVNIQPTINSATSPVLAVRNNTQSYPTIQQFSNTNAQSAIIQWNTTGQSGAGNFIFRTSLSGNEEFARFTKTGNFNLSKDLDVDGHTELDNVNISGVTTFNSNVHLLDNDYARFGSSQDLSIFHDGTHNWFWSGGGHPTIHESSGSWTLRSVANQNYIIATENNSVDLYYSGNKKFETTNTGAVVTGILTATSFSGDGSNLTGIVGVPSGCIILWSGAANAIPSGFVLCNGSNGTPDLRGKFVVGYHNSNGDYDVGDTGGSANATLVSHSHTINNHTHSFSATTNNPGNHDHRVDVLAEFASSHGVWQTGGGYRQVHTGGTHRKPLTSDAGGHTHSISGTTGNPSNRGTDSQGSSATNANLPPYYALCYIMKT